MEQIPHFIISDQPNDDEVPELALHDSKDTQEHTLKVRLDKWLWAARFFKTRALARAAVEKGRVFYNGQRIKPSIEIQLDARVLIRQSHVEKLVVIKGLSTRRRCADEAFALFEELPLPQQHPKADLETTYPPAPEKRPKKLARFLRQPISRPETNTVCPPNSSSK